MGSGGPTECNDSQAPASIIPRVALIALEMAQAGSGAIESRNEVPRVESPSSATLATAHAKGFAVRRLIEPGAVASDGAAHRSGTVLNESGQFQTLIHREF